MADASAQWFVATAPQLILARNRHETAGFRELVEGYQALLAREGRRPSDLSLSQSLASTTDGDGGSDAYAQKYLTTIQHLEQELNEKNAQLAEYAGSHLRQNQELMQLRNECNKAENQAQVVSRQVEEEQILGVEKDKMITELDGALRVSRQEVCRYRELLEKAESDNAQLREQLSGNETGLAEVKNGNLSASQQSVQSEDKEVGRVTQIIGDHTFSRQVSSVQHVIRAHAIEANAVAFNASGKLVFSASSDGTVRAWDSASGRPVGEYRGKGSTHPLLCVRGSEDGETVLGAGSDRKAFLWRAGPGRVIQSFTGHKGKVLAAEFLVTQPHQVVTGSSDRSLRIWDVNSGRSLQTLSCRSGCNSLSVAKSSCGQFASAHVDGSVRLWDERTRHEEREVKGLHEGQTTSVSLAEETPLLVSNGRDNKLQVLDVRTMGVLVTLQHKHYHSGFDWNDAGVSPDGIFVAAGSVTGQVFLWDTRNGKMVQEMSGGHQGAVACCTWRPDGTGVASCDKNGVVVLWQ